MGYYSDVAIAMKKKDFNEMESAIYCHMLDKNQQKLIKNALRSAEKTEIERNSEDYLVLRWPYIKWDNFFCEVKYIKDYLSRMPHHDFVRIGEHYDDVEVHHGTELCLIDVERSISINEY